MTNEFTNPWDPHSRRKETAFCKLFCAVPHMKDINVKKVSAGYGDHICNPSTQEVETVGSWAVDSDTVSININPFS